MKILILFIAMISFFYGAELKVHKIKTVESSNLNSLKVRLIEISEKLEEGYIPKRFIEIEDKNDKYLVNLEDARYLETIEGYKSLDNKRLLLFTGTSINSFSYLLNIKKQTISSLGGGRASYTDENLFLLSNRKGYIFKNDLPNGAFWYDILVDDEGNIIKFQSKPKNSFGCKKISALFNDMEKYRVSKLEQNLDDCIYITR